jgi:hypothetical protein
VDLATAALVKHHGLHMQSSKIDKMICLQVISHSFLLMAVVMSHESGKNALHGQREKQ